MGRIILVYFRVCVFLLKPHHEHIDTLLVFLPFTHRSVCVYCFTDLSKRSFTGLEFFIESLSRQQA